MEGKIYEPSRMVINPMSLAKNWRGFMTVQGDVRKIYTSGWKEVKLRDLQDSPQKMLCGF